MTTEIFNDDVQIQGSQDEVQLLVQGPSSQTADLQQWKIAGQDPLVRLTGDGRLQLGTLETGTADALIEANHDIDLDTEPNAPQQGLQTRGIFRRAAQAISNSMAWSIHELEFQVSNTLSGVHSALRSKVFHHNTDDSSNAELRAGDFEVVNLAGTVGTAVGVEIQLVNSGTMVEAYGLRVQDVDQGTTNYAIHTSAGPVHLGDYVELAVPPDLNMSNPSSGVKLYPKADGKLYFRNSTGEQEVGAGSENASQIGYTPTNLSHWTSTSDPGEVDDALDQLASRVTTIESANPSDGDASEVTYSPADTTNWNNSADPGNVDDALDQLADRVQYLATERAYVSQTYRPAGYIQTTSTSFVDVDATNVKVTITPQNSSRVLVGFSFTGGGGTTYAGHFDILQVGGSRAGDATYGMAQADAGPTPHHYTLMAIFTGLTPGTEYTFRLQMKTNSSSQNVSIYLRPMQFIGMEI